ncbi:hypothetical protein [Nisaea sp.]|uniref:hypothetical protein n=1 Tax=Nisaea sp. TaxID=2024842 RepID=UPI002B278B05|nr:hypothetical protein [Nisaea sp.]
MTVFKDVSDETRAARLRRIAQLKSIGKVKDIEAAYPALSRYELSQLLEESEGQLSRDDLRRTEIEANWKPPETREAISQTVVGLCETVSWLGLGKKLNPEEFKDYKATADWEASARTEVAIEWAWDILRDALLLEDIQAKGSRYGREPKDIIRQSYFEDPIFPSFTKADALSVDPNNAFDVGVDAIERFERVTFLVRDLEELVQYLEDGLRPNASEMRSPGRPTDKQKILQNLKKRIENDDVCETLASEARYQFGWCEKEMPLSKYTPNGPKSMENIIRIMFNKNKRKKAEID